VIAIHVDGGVLVNPDPSTTLPRDAEIVVIGTDESEQKFLDLHLDR